ncbi:ABC transporter substrate-binding protein [Pseudolactococcus reticulitermitis]|uniref:SsuA/THI5-like domain-containing protein n=1 Tax=Pseudolactococcus reticulitermitis TaxID=2025039 RepID=A0A224X0I6_9LACT|nr:NrtA/SsuA/CpmA family ABC transporter substrate-binding protein [Lactococcus reticulitermitis]GAX46476.1 hypothetical protein RsY01_55 [Lactococcus reticulitermitis]
MKFKTLLTLTATFIIGLGALSACTTNSSKTTTKEDKKSYAFKAINVTYVKSPLNVPSMVEKDQKMFAKAYKPYGLDVTYSDLTTGPEQTQALVSGDVQFLNCVGSTSVILAAANGADIKIISAYNRSQEAYQLFGAKGTSIKSAADLKGKKVAGPKGTVLHELLLTYLASANLTEKDIDFVSMDIPSTQAALLAGKIDAALLAGPTAYTTEKEGYPIITTGKDLIDPVALTATSTKFYNENPELVKAFVKTQQEILEYMANNYDETMAISAKETGLELSAVESMYPMYDFDSTLKKSDVASLKKTQDFMLENKMIDQKIDIDKLFIYPVN